MKNNQELKIINIGIIGHIDHGKTTLLEKLSGKWASQHSEELKRGITIKLGYADNIIYEDNGEFNIEKKGKPIRHISFVDAPGHEMLMSTMLSGAAMMDAAILVIAANEGIKSQTREHLMALQAKGVKQLIVVQNKIDLIDEKKAIENYKEIKQLIEGKFKNTNVIPVSALQNVNINEVLKAICELEVPDRKENEKPIFLIARSFDINRPGTEASKLHGAVLGGILKQGKLKIGDEIEIKPGRLYKESNQYKYDSLKTKIKSLYLGSKNVEELTPGGSASIETTLDMALGKSDILSGNITSTKNNLPETTQKIKIKIEMFKTIYLNNKETKLEPIKPSEMLMISLNTTITGGNVLTIKNEIIEMNLKTPIVPFENEYVGIAKNIEGHWRLIGFGNLIK